jgi:hypothetical protein
MRIIDGYIGPEPGEMYTYLELKLDDFTYDLFIYVPDGLKTHTTIFAVLLARAH